MFFDGYRFDPNSKPHGDIEFKPVTEEEVKRIHEMMSQFDLVEPIFYTDKPMKGFCPDLYDRIIKAGNLAKFAKEISRKEDIL